VSDLIVCWLWDITDPMEINLPDPGYPSDDYVAKMPPWLVNIYTGWTKRWTAIEKFVSESATYDCSAIAMFPDLIVQYRQLLK
jgi:hypothetical protein